MGNYGEQSRYFTGSNVDFLLLALFVTAPYSTSDNLLTLMWIIVFVKFITVVFTAQST